MRKRNRFPVGNGSLPASAIQVRTSYERQGPQLTGNIRVLLRNSGDRPLAIAIKDNSYKTGAATKTIAAHQEMFVVLPLGKSHSWYDFTVQAEDSKAEARYAGHVDTGNSSFTDPVMGGLM